MRVAFAYACQQLFGMQFEAFRLTTDGRRYTWGHAALWRWLLTWLVRCGLDEVAYTLFRAVVVVE